MLKIINQIKDLSFASLMNVYEETNRRTGLEQYSQLSDNMQLIFAEQDFYQYLTEIFFKTSSAVYAVWVQSDSYAAALRIEPYQDGFLLAALETKPELRGVGYATKLLKSVIQYCNQSEKNRLYSHIEKTNLPSIAVHKKCGFKKILDHAVYADGSVLHSSATYYIEF